MPEDERGDRELVGKAMLAGQREVEARAMAALMGVAAEAVAILAKVPLAMAVAAEVGGVMEEAIVAGGTAACMVVVQRVVVMVDVTALDAEASWVAAMVDASAAVAQQAAMAMVAMAAMALPGTVRQM